MFGEFEGPVPVMTALFATPKAEPVATEDTTDERAVVVDLGHMSGGWLREFTVRAVCGERN